MRRVVQRRVAIMRMDKWVAVVGRSRVDIEIGMVG